VEQQKDLFEDVKMSDDLQNQITELSNSLITSIDLRTEEKELSTHLTDSCVDLGSEESKEVGDSVEEKIEKKIVVADGPQLIESCVDLGSEETESKPEEVAVVSAEEVSAVENGELTDSCVDLMGENGDSGSVDEGGEENLEENQKPEAEDYQPNASMEIIDKKQCENDEDYEKGRILKLWIVPRK